MQGNFKVHTSNSTTNILPQFTLARTFVHFFKLSFFNFLFLFFYYYSMVCICIQHVYSSIIFCSTISLCEAFNANAFAIAIQKKFEQQQRTIHMHNHTIVCYIKNNNNKHRLLTVAVHFQLCHTIIHIYRVSQPVSQSYIHIVFKTE